MKNKFLSVLFWGAMWGIGEATIGNLIHLGSIALPGLPGFVMFPVAFYFMRIGFKNMWLFIGCSVVLYHVAIEQARAAEHRPGAPGGLSEPRPATYEGRRAHHV